MVGDDHAPRTSVATSSGLDALDARRNAVLELDDVFDALGHSRRRYLLYTLVNGSGEERLTELATSVAAWEEGVPRDEVSDEKRRRVRVSLYHTHVPKLADLDVLDYEVAGDVTVRATATEQVQAVLEGAGGELDSRQETHARGVNDDQRA